MKLNDIGIDSDSSKLGRLFIHDTGIKVRISMLGNSDYISYFREITEPDRDKFRDGTISEEKINEYTKRAIAEKIVRNWENVEDDNGDPIPYTPEFGFECFMDPKFKKFYQWILVISEDELNYRQGNIQKAVKN